MPAMKSAREAIDEFVDAIAQSYVASRDEPNGHDSVAEEFVSSIENDLKSTLRQRLSQLDTVKEVEETPTMDVPQSAILADVDGNEVDLGVSVAADPSHMDQTIDSAINLQEITQLRESPHSGEVATMELGAALSSHGVRPAVRIGKSPEYADLSYDDSATMDTGNVVGRSSGSKAPDIPDGYEILGILGKGGMGIVYKARHVPLNRLVAVKMIIQGEHASDEQLRRFQIEAEAAAHLSHPNIVSVYEV
ncbi:MAG: hypothetical protein WBD20_05295, partial [Pirellulaceae bacterium]